MPLFRVTYSIFSLFVLYALFLPQSACAENLMLNNMHIAVQQINPSVHPYLPSYFPSQFNLTELNLQNKYSGNRLNTEYTLVASRNKRFALKGRKQQSIHWNDMPHSFSENIRFSYHKVSNGHSFWSKNSEDRCLSGHGRVMRYNSAVGVLSLCVQPQKLSSFFASDYLPQNIQIPAEYQRNIKLSLLPGSARTEIAVYGWSVYTLDPKSVNISAKLFDYTELNQVISSLTMY